MKVQSIYIQSYNRTGQAKSLNNNKVKYVNNPTFKQINNDYIQRAKDVFEQCGVSKHLCLPLAKACEKTNCFSIEPTIKVIKMLYSEIISCSYKFEKLLPISVADNIIQSLLGNDLENPMPISHGTDILLNESFEYLQNDSCRDFICSFLKNVTGKDRDDILCNLAYNLDKFMVIPKKYKEKKEEALKYYGEKDKYSQGYMSKLKEEVQNVVLKCSYEDFADKNGNISKDSMDAAIEIAKKSNEGVFLGALLNENKSKDGVIEIEKDAYHEKFRHFVQEKSEEQIFNEYKNQNLYLPEIFFNLLSDLYKNKLLSCYDTKIFHKEIGKYGKLFMQIPELVQGDEHKEAYNKIMHFLSCIHYPDEDLLNMTENDNISFLEKVINSGSEKLLDVVINLSYKRPGAILKYFPQLDWAYNGITDKNFKEQIDERLYLNFADLKDAVRMENNYAWEKVKNQLDSPLCRKSDVVRDLYSIAKENNNSFFCFLLMTQYKDCFSDYDIQSFNDRFKNVFK